MSKKSAEPRQRTSIEWLLRTAWRDSRNRRRALFLLTLCVVLGIAALTAVQGFRANLERTIEAQARSLLGADLELRSNVPFPAEIEAWIIRMGGRQTREITFNSMAWFPDIAQSRLVRVRAIDGDFPFYGAFDRIPPDAFWEDPSDASGAPSALVEDALVRQFGINQGSAVHLGNTPFHVRGSVLRMAGEGALEGIFAPRIYVSLDHLDDTGLIAYGSIRRHRVYFAWPDGLTPERSAALRRAQEQLFPDHHIRSRTVEDEKRQLGRSLTNLYSFLNITAFSSLLLGGIGVAGAVQVYLKGKRASIALLRCLGVSVRSAFAVYLIQVGTLGLIGALVGVILGTAIQFILPVIVGPLLPFTVETQIHWTSLVFSLLFGWIVASLFALIPLLPLRRIPPLAALRADVEPLRRHQDVAVWLTMAAIVAIGVLFCISQASTVKQGIGFAAGLASLFAALGILATLLRASMRRCARWSLPFSIRQGISNLYRPNNRTLFLVVTLGAGAFLLHTLYLSRDLLLSEITKGDRARAPNLVFFDIQSDQRADIERMIEDTGFPIFEISPIVTMRLSEINDVTISTLRENGINPSSNWAYTREYRSSYRSELTDAETLIAGTFISTWDGSEPIPVSIEEGLSETLGVALGDTLVFDVQGVPITTEIASVRKVDWRQIRTNFFFVFPAGVLEEAPAFYALVTRAQNRESAMELQNMIALAFPNVSAIDLSLLLDTINEILDKAAFVIEFMALFTLATGCVVLASAIWTSRYQRIRESALLRTLGATNRQLQNIMMLEYALVGVLSGTVGVLLSMVAGYGIARFMFEVAFFARWAPAVMIIAAITVLALASGMLFSRGILSKPPLEVLRTED